MTNFDARFVPGASSSATKWISYYISMLDDSIPCPGYRQPFTPEYYSDHMIKLWEDITFNAIGFKANQTVTMYGKVYPSSDYSVWLSPNSILGAVHGIYLNTNQSFARTTL